MYAQWPLQPQPRGAVGTVKQLDSRGTQLKAWNNWDDS